MLNAIPRFSSTTIALRALPQSTQNTTQTAYAIENIAFNLQDNRTDVFVQHHNVAGKPVGEATPIADSLVGTSKNLRQFVIGAGRKASLERLPNMVLTQFLSTLMVNKDQARMGLYLSEKKALIPDRLHPGIMGKNNFRVAFDYLPLKAADKGTFQVSTMTLYFPNQWLDVTSKELAEARQCKG